MAIAGRTVVLVYGDPSAGKTTLAEKLRNECTTVISVDDVYVRFIRDQFPNLYFPFLPVAFIWSHWHYIVGLVRQNAELPQIKDLGDVEAAWRDHLYNVIENELRDFPCVVVEGYLVGAIDSVSAYTTLFAVRAKLLENNVIVHTFKVVNKQVFPVDFVTSISATLDPRGVTVEEIAGVLKSP